MTHQFSEELQYLSEIEEMLESTTLLQDKRIRERFEILMELKDELSNMSTDSGEQMATESILEDISLITREITELIEFRSRERVLRENLVSKRNINFN